MPSFFQIVDMQCERLLNLRFWYFDVMTSAFSCVFESSNGKTKNEETIPAQPPAATFPAKNLYFSFLQSYGQKYF